MAAAAPGALGNLRLFEVEFEAMTVPRDALTACTRSGQLERLTLIRCDGLDRSAVEAIAMAPRLRELIVKDTRLPVATNVKY